MRGTREKAMTEFTLHEAAKSLKEGKTTSVALTQAALNRIESSELNAFNTMCGKSARKQAEAADERLARGEKGSPLLGIPVAVKDNICTEGIRTTCSSKFLENYVPPYDACAVERLKEAGAVIIGKTNMDEFAMGSSNESSVFGAVKNPVNPERVPGGSSGGSAAAVGGGLCYAALGTDTGGSIRQPAALCGVVGLKPSYGRVSRYGLIAFASSLDQIGCFTRSVRDAAYVLGAISGHDKRDSTSSPKPAEDFTSKLGMPVKGLKIGIARNCFADGLNPQIKQSVLAASEVFRSGGAELVDIELKLSRVSLSAYYVIACAEAASNLARFDGIKYGARAGGCEDLLETYVKTRTEFFGPEVKNRIMLGNYVLSSGYYDAYYLKAMKVRRLIVDEYAEVLSNCDLVLLPTAPTTAFRFGEKFGNPLEMYLSDVYTVAANLAGLPAISVPCGKDKDGLPIGMQLVGRAFEESPLLAAADYYEREEGAKWITRS